MLPYFVKVILTVFLGIAFLYIIFNWKLHCPKCRRVFAAKITGKKVVKTKKVKEMVWNEKKGVDEEQTVNYKTYKYEYTCKHCKHKWKVRKQEG